MLLAMGCQTNGDVLESTWLGLQWCMFQWWMIDTVEGAVGFIRLGSPGLIFPGLF